MFAVNRFFAKVQLFLQNNHCLQDFFLHKACGTPPVTRYTVQRDLTPPVACRSSKGAMRRALLLRSMCQNLCSSLAQVVQHCCTI